MSEKNMKIYKKLLYLSLNGIIVPTDIRVKNIFEKINK